MAKCTESGDEDELRFREDVRRFVAAQDAQQNAIRRAEELQENIMAYLTNGGQVALTGEYSFEYDGESFVFQVSKHGRFGARRVDTWDGPPDADPRHPPPDTRHPA